MIIKIPVVRLRKSHNYYVLNERIHYKEYADKALEGLRKVWIDHKMTIPFFDLWISIIRLAKGKPRHGYYFYDESVEIVMVNTDFIPRNMDFENMADAIINSAKKKP